MAQLPVRHILLDKLTVRTIFITSLIVLIAILRLESQDVYATQSWELSFDKQQDGWVDSGDRILVSTELSTYDSLNEVISFHNFKESPFLSLVPNSITSSHGKIAIEPENNDSTVIIHSISLSSIGEKATISFEYVVDFSFSQDVNIGIQNYASVRLRDQVVTTNIIEIPIRSQINTQESLLKHMSKYALLGLCIVIFILFALKIKSKNAPLNLVAD